MKLLDPLGGLLVTSGSVVTHIIFLITYLVLWWMPWFDFANNESWVVNYFYWWMATHFLILVFAGIYSELKSRKITYMEGLPLWVCFVFVLLYWYMILCTV
jgi:hypothetical protein